jgi:uncharacterized protein YlbG (UPF0298 family)
MVGSVTSFGDQARIGALWSLREERKVRTMGEPVDAYLLYVNQQQVPEVFETLERIKWLRNPTCRIRQRFRSREPEGRSAIGIINII